MSFDLSENEVQLVKCVLQFFFRHIRVDHQSGSNPVFKLFDERRYHKKSSIWKDSLYETTETHVATFILSILHQGLFSLSSLIGGIIYMSRMKEHSRVSLHTFTWRLLFITSILVADKVLEETPIRNESLCRLFPVVTCAELAKLELEFVSQMNFKLFLKPELFDSFVKKLMKENPISDEIDQIVLNSDFVSQFILPNMKTLTHTPDLFPPQSTTPITIVKASRLSRVLSNSTFIDKTFVNNVPQPQFSLSSRRRSSSVRRSPSVGPSAEETSSLDHSKIVGGAAPGYKRYPITALTSHRRVPAASRWNNTF